VLFLGLLKRFKLRHRAPKPDLMRRRLDEIDRHEATCTLLKAVLDHEMRERTGDGIDHDTQQLTTGAVATYDFAANRELRGFAHEVPLVWSHFRLGAPLGALGKH
jgi:hypothetical protein